MSRPEKETNLTETNQENQKKKKKTKQTELIVADASPLHSHFPPGCKPGYYLFIFYLLSFCLFVFLSAIEKTFCKENW